MIIKIADNIISPLGLTSIDNYEAVMAGETRLQVHTDKFGLPEPFCGSLLDREYIAKLAVEIGAGKDKYTFFEQLCILTATRAIKESGIDPKENDTVFILSTTKGNVSLLEGDLNDPRCYLGYSAQKVAHHFGNKNTALVVSNACISGVCAQIAGVRSLLSGRYRKAVIIGADTLSRFIVSGFQSFMALSRESCRPYDLDRKGLNLGEAAGTIILVRKDSEGLNIGGDLRIWEYEGSSIHNDANHISGPSRTGEGSYRVLSDILNKMDVSEIAFINAHGTATAYNDEMESIAIHRAGIDTMPVNGLKGYYGHTLGAAGIIETIMSMKAIEHGKIPATKGFSKLGTSYTIGVSDKIRETNRNGFIKLLSGFGGSNAGIGYRLHEINTVAM